MPESWLTLTDTPPPGDADDGSEVKTLEPDTLLVIVGSHLEVTSYRPFPNGTTNITVKRKADAPKLPDASDG